MKDDRKFLTKREVAALLRLSLYTIDSWVSQRRELPFVRMGSRVMFDANDVQAWIDKNRVRPE
jgi:excisionase family DNA binding protein